MNLCASRSHEYRLSRLCFANAEMVVHMCCLQRPALGDSRGKFNTLFERSWIHYMRCLCLSKLLTMFKEIQGCWSR